MPPTQPDYVGIMMKSMDTDNKCRTIESSEIVDLDTKEIKTVETDIDMERKPFMKNETETSSSSTTTTTKSPDISKEEAEEKTPNDNKKLEINDIKPTASNMNIEREARWTDGVPYDWALDLMKKYEPDLIENSPKMEVFFCILHESIKLNDRVLLFSQSLLTLNLIERFLQANYVPGSESYWGRNTSYFRLDGSTSSQEREKLVNEFNSNTNVKLFLISTRAGSLGINLVGANRVVVFDASWNPCHDTQAVYRIYRYGQQKACFVYRIVMDKCLEKKIYDRQIKKQGMSDRVVDECNPDAHLSHKDVTNLCHDYDYDNTKTDDEDNFKSSVESYDDVIVQKVLEQYKSRLSKEPFYHESLLIDRKEKKLSQAEKRLARRGYEMEKKASIKQTANYSNNKVQYRIVRNDGVTTTRPIASIRPMHKNQQNTMRNGGVRSTRWIPAEVWQRQGMTAQEMTLPLDVVIPTNSSDKSNIILKAGQRVMVLKSAKGIYMQLDSGKIIAIRTSSKATDTTKTETKSNEVIDITAENENNANNQTTTNSSSSTVNTTTTFSNLTSNSSLDTNTKTTNSTNVNSTTNNEKVKTTLDTTKALNMNNNHRGDNHQQQQQQHQYHNQIQYATQHSNNQKKTSNQNKIDENKLIRNSNLSKKNLNPIIHHQQQQQQQRSEQFLNNHKKNPHLIESLTSKPQQPMSNYNDVAQQQQPQQLHHQTNNLYTDYSHHYGNKTNTIRDNDVITNHEQKSTTNSNDINNPYETTHKNNLNTYETNPTSSNIQNIPILPKNEKKEQSSQQSQSQSQSQSINNDNFQNTTNTTFPIKPKSEIPNDTNNHNNTDTNSNGANNIPPTYVNYNQQQQQQQAKLRLYMPQYGLPTPTQQHMHSHYNNTIIQPPPPPLPPPSSQQQSQPPSQQTQPPQSLPPPQPSPTTTTTPHVASYAAKNPLFGKAQDVHSYAHQYYENMYDCNNMSGINEYAPTSGQTSVVPPPTSLPPPVPVPVPQPAYTDYTAYANAHHHSPYHHGNFQTNTYAPMRASPYHMHWPPLVTSTSLAEHHVVNSMFPTTNYPTDTTTQTNQWHHQ